MKKSTARNTIYYSIITRGLSFILSLSLFFFCPATALAGWYSDDENDHGNVSYAELQYTGFDESELLNALQNMETLCQGAGNDDAILENYRIMAREFDKLITQQTINNLRYYNDVNNVEYRNVHTELSNLITDLADKSGHTLHIVLNSGYYQIIADAIDSPDLTEFYLDYQDMTKEEKDLVSETNDLVQQYDRASNQRYSYTDADGRVWTESSLNANTAIRSDAEKYNEILQGIAESKNAALTDIFIALVKKRNRLAQLRGYKNYAEYAYEDLYNRDYSVEDAKKLYASVKKYFAPAVPAIYHNTMEILDVNLLYMPGLTEDTIAKEVGENIGKIDPELLKAYDYMCRYHLYDMKFSPTRMELGYTDILYEYREPVIFTCPSNTYYDYSTLIHEFGHYNNAFHNMKTSFVDPVNMDVAEIHSQGMELLYLEYDDKLYEDMGDSARLLTLYNIASSVTEGCLYDEFQNIVYASEEELTTEELNDLFYTLASEYGCTKEEAERKRYSWTDISHTFQSPMYYISYATSALSALDIFFSSLENRQKAIDQYMSLTTYGLGTPYCELIKTIGLRDIFEEETVKDIAAASANYSRDLVQHKASEQSYKFIKKVMIVLAIVIALIAAIALTLERILKKKSDPEGGPDDVSHDPDNGSP